jgi:hypothetical protein
MKQNSINEDMDRELPPATCPRPKDDLERMRVFEGETHPTCAKCYVFICPYVERKEVHAPGL